MEAQYKFERLSELLKIDPGNLQLRRDCVDAAVQSQNYDHAIAVADGGLLLSPGDEMLLFGKSNALIGRSEYHEAIQVLVLLHTLHLENNAISQNLALCNYCVGNYADARNRLEAIYADGDRTPGVIRLLVSSCHHLGLMDRAVAVADANKELARTDSALAGVYALMYLDDSRAADAAKCAAYSLRANPRCVDALTADATLRLAAGDVDAAKRTFENILSVNPNIGRAWLGLGSMALLRRDFVNAKLDLTRGLESMPNHVGSWHMLGWTHLVANEIDDAERVFEHAMELNRNFSETHGALAAIAAIRGQIDKAQEMIKVALRLDPNAMAARFAQSVIAARSGDLARSQQIISDTLGKFAGTESATFRRLLTMVTGNQPQSE